MSIALVLALVTTQAGEVKASFLLTMTSTDSTASLGGTGAFDVTLTNDAGASSSASVAAFAFDISLPSTSGITLTGVTEPADATFIFNGNNFGLTPPGAVVTSSRAYGNDLALTGATTISAGQTFVLVHVAYSVASNAPSSPVPITINLIPPSPNIVGGSYVTDGSGTDLKFGTGTGQITINGINPAPVPEPSTLGMGGIAAMALTGFWARRRRNSAV